MPRSVNGVLQVDEHGRLILPPEIAARLGLTPGREAMFSLHGEALHITPPIEHLARVNLEITNACNLDCATCMRNVWDEPIGRMDAALFARVLNGLCSFAPRPLVFFGGYGEPLAHPDVVEMVRQVKALGCTAELITNGILLHPQTAAALLDAGLDTLWVSLDGATPEHYSDVRLGAELPRVLENIAHLRQLRDRNSSTRPQIGIAFVAMQSNIADLPEVLRLGAHLGAERFSVSNVLAHTPQLNREVLYRRCLDRNTRPDAHPQVDLPYMDLSPETTAALAGVLDGPYDTWIAGERLRQPAPVCPFIRKASLSIRWDGAVSPCLPLLHTHTSHLGQHERQSLAHTVGHLAEHSLNELWQAEDYQALRRRLQHFDFSPCVFCNSCEMADANREDCFGNRLPTCGGCLWAQGLIQCP